MFNSKNLISDIADVPAAWIFERYLGLESQLNGQTIRLNSFEKPAGARLPLALYYAPEKGCYRWKDWVSGKGGSAVDLMMLLWKKTFRDCANQIESDYYAYCQAGLKPEVTAQMSVFHWKLVKYYRRTWTSDDAAYWSPFNISSTLLEEHHVCPLSGFVMEQFIDGVSTNKTFEVSGRNIYGYFNAQTQELYKTYQPLNPDKKFMKVGNYLQGVDQLVGHKYLCITSSMKDLLACKSLGLKVDYVAPDSENNLLSKDCLEMLLEKYQYQGICTLLDNDSTGIENMKKYRSKYGIHPCYLPLKKDPSDSIKMLGIQPVLERLAPGLQRACALFTGISELVLA